MKRNALGMQVPHFPYFLPVGAELTKLTGAGKKFVCPSDVCSAALLSTRKRVKRARDSGMVWGSGEDGCPKG